MRALRGREAVLVRRAERSRRHALKADRKRTVSLATSNGLDREDKGGRAGRAVVVDVDDGDTGHAELVEDTLATGRVAVNVTGSCGLHSIVGDTSVDEGLDGRLDTKVVILAQSAGLVELGRTDTDDWCERLSKRGMWSRAYASGEEGGRWMERRSYSCRVGDSP